MKDARDTKKRRTATTSAQPTIVVSDDPDVLAQQAREAMEKSAAELRKQRVPIETEPPTAFRP